MTSELPESMARPSLCAAPGSELADALRERDAYFAEAARTKETLALIIPALERASGANADELRATVMGVLTPDEWAGLWMAHTIMEAPNEKAQAHWALHVRICPARDPNGACSAIVLRTRARRVERLQRSPIERDRRGPRGWPMRRPAPLQSD